MSLLADLLSKNKTDASHGDTSKAPVVDIPPTLFKAHGIPAKVRKLNNRYVIVAVLSVTFIAFGILLVAKFELLRSSTQKKPQLPPIQQQTALVVSTPAVKTEQTARINLEEPPPPCAAEKKFPVTESDQHLASGAED